MGVRSKALFTVVLVVAVVGFLTIQSRNPALFEGNLANTTEDQTSSEPANLSADFDILEPLPDNEDIRVDFTIKNEGPGTITTPFSYKIFLDGIEVFTNSDSFIEMAPGESFGYIYPIPKTIYQYGNSGQITLQLVPSESLEQTDTLDDSLTKEFSF